MKLGMQELEYINLIEGMTKAHVKDCVVSEDEIVVIIEAGDMGLAIGRKGENAERVRKKIGKKISFIEFSPEREEFIKKLFAPAVLESIEFGDDSVKIVAKESQRVIGKSGKRKKRAEVLLGRHFGIKNVIVS